MRAVGRDARAFAELGYRVTAFDAAPALVVRAVAVLGRLVRALVPGGVLYASFKYGVGERERGGRWFTDLDEAGLAVVVDAMAGVRLELVWVTGDQRPGREAERWLNALMRRELTGGNER